MVCTCFNMFHEVSVNICTYLERAKPHQAAQGAERVGCPGSRPEQLHVVAGALHAPTANGKLVKNGVKKRHVFPLCFAVFAQCFPLAMPAAVRADFRQFKTVRASTVKEAKATVVAGLAAEGLPNWHCDRRSPAKAVRCTIVCKNHVGCLVRIKMNLMTGCEELWRVGITGEHAATCAPKKRSNSATTAEVEAYIKTKAMEGMSPAAILSQLEDKLVTQKEAAGLDPLTDKRPEGGLNGACPACELCACNVLVVFL